MRRSVCFLALVIALLVAACDMESSTPPLRLSIESDKGSYNAGETITLILRVTNVTHEPVGFYVRDAGSVRLMGFESKGARLPSYYHPSWQRAMPPLYPDEYIHLEPNQTWEHTSAFPLKWGTIEDFLEMRSKAEPGAPTVIHRGLYIDTPESITEDHILLPSDMDGNVGLAVEFSTSPPNPRGFTVEDCVAASIPMDIFPEDSRSSRIIHTIRPVVSESHLDDPSQVDPRAWEKALDLEMYCEHNTALTRTTWIGVIQSDVIAIEVHR